MDRKHYCTHVFMEKWIDLFGSEYSEEKLVQRQVQGLGDIFYKNK